MLAAFANANLYVYMYTQIRTPTDSLSCLLEKNIDYLDKCDRDAYVHSSHQCVPSPTKYYDATGTNLMPAYTRHVTV